MPTSSFRCPCGFMIEAAPQIGDSVVSAYHLHKEVRLDGSSTLVRMEEIPRPVLEREVACALGGLENRHAVSAAGKPHPRPHRRAA